MQQCPTKIAADLQTVMISFKLYFTVSNAFFRTELSEYRIFDDKSIVKKIFRLQFKFDPFSLFVFMKTESDYLQWSSISSKDATRFSFFMFQEKW